MMETMHKQGGSSQPTSMKSEVEPKPKVCRTWVMDFLVVWTMPFLYGFNSYLPFIFMVIHLTKHFRLDWIYIGLLVGCNRLCRIGTMTVAVYAPATAHGLASCLSLSGYVIVLISDQLWAFALGTTLAGFAETISCFQSYAKSLYKDDLCSAKTKVKRQFAVHFLGSTFAFGVGGYVFSTFGVNGAAMIGLGTSACELMVLVSFLQLKRLTEKERMDIKKIEEEIFIKDDDDPFLGQGKVVFEWTSWEDTMLTKASTVTVGGDPMIQVSDLVVMESRCDEMETRVEKEGVRDDIYETLSLEDDNGDGDDDDDDDNENSLCDDLRYVDKEFGGNTTKKGLQKPTSLAEAPVRRLSVLSDDMVTYVNKEFSSSELPPHAFDYFVSATIGVRGLFLGFCYNMGPLFALERYGASSVKTGLVFAMGTVAGTSLSILAATPWGHLWLSRVLPSPHHIWKCLTAVAMAMVVAGAAPVYVVHAGCLIAVVTVGQLLGTLTTEFQASISSLSTYRTTGPLGQIFYQLCFLATDLSGPVLFGVFPETIFYVSASLTLTWAVLSFCLLKKRKRRSSDLLCAETGLTEADLAPLTFEYIENARRMSERGLVVLLDATEMI